MRVENCIVYRVVPIAGGYIIRECIDFVDVQ